MNQTPSTTAKTSPLGSSEHARSATRTGRKAQVALDLHDLPTALAALRGSTDPASNAQKFSAAVGRLPQLRDAR